MRLNNVSSLTTIQVHDTATHGHSEFAKSSVRSRAMVQCPKRLVTMTVAQCHWHWRVASTSIAVVGVSHIGTAGRKDKRTGRSRVLLSDTSGRYITAINFEVQFRHYGTRNRQNSLLVLQRKLQFDQISQSIVERLVMEIVGIMIEPRKRAP